MGVSLTESIKPKLSNQLTKVLRSEAVFMSVCVCVCARVGVGVCEQVCLCVYLSVCL